MDTGKECVGRYRGHRPTNTSCESSVTANSRALRPCKTYLQSGQAIPPLHLYLGGAVNIHLGFSTPWSDRNQWSVMVSGWCLNLSRVKPGRTPLGSDIRSIWEAFFWSKSSQWTSRIIPPRLEAHCAQQQMHSTATAETPCPLTRNGEISRSSRLENGRALTIDICDGITISQCVGESYIWAKRLWVPGFWHLFTAGWFLGVPCLASEWNKSGLAAAQTPGRPTRLTQKVLRCGSRI